MQYDGIVIGAGPAGGIAALRLAGAGARVLLLEKQALGRDKPCGGGLTVRAWQGLEVPIEDLVLSRVNSGELSHQGRHPVRIALGEREVWMVRRRDMDRRIALTAADSGADLHDREPAESIGIDARGFSVRTAKSTYRGTTLLLATGAEGALRASLGLEQPSTTLAVALEIEADAGAEHLDPCRLYFDYRIPGGYAWAFPKNGCWNVGVLTARRAVARRLRSLLGEYLTDTGIRFTRLRDPLRHAHGRRIPFRRPHAVLTRGGAALIGDAAGLADPFFGEGIAQAFISGRFAADAALRLLRGQAETLSPYQTSIDRMLKAHSQRMRMVASVVYRTPVLALRALSVPGGERVALKLGTEPFATEA